MNLEKQIEAVRKILTARETRETRALNSWLSNGTRDYEEDRLSELEECQEDTERVSKQLQRLERALMVRDWQQKSATSAQFKEGYAQGVAAMAEFSAGGLVVPGAVMGPFGPELPVHGEAQQDYSAQRGQLLPEDQRGWALPPLPVPTVTDAVPDGAVLHPIPQEVLDRAEARRRQEQAVRLTRGSGGNR